MRYFVNSRGLLEAIMKRGLTQTQAAELVGMKLSNFHEYLQGDKAIKTTTAYKFREQFGDGAIYIGK